MPTRTDVTVVNSAYDTSGNGGRKLVRLSNGWLVAAVKNADVIYFYKSTDNGATWSLHYTVTGQSASSCTTNVAIASKGNVVYALIGLYTSGAGRRYEVHTLNFDTSTNSNIILDASSIVSAVGYGTIVVYGSEIHAAWSCITGTYPNSYNIRYAKGTINGDGSVTWGAVEQVTTANGEPS